MELSGTTVAITGAASGIGRAIAGQLAGRGCRLALADVDTDGLDGVVEGLRTAGVDVIGVRTDVRDGDAVQAFADATIDAFGDVDVVVNNAGVSTVNLLEHQSLADWRWVVDVNLMGVVHGVHAFLPHLIDRPEARVVNVASIGGLQSGIAFLGPYAATKAAVVSISETLAVELAGYHPNVGVTVLCPANTDTGVLDAERNRPAELGTEQRTDDAEAWRLGIKASFTDPTGMSADAVAEKLVEGVEADQFFVFSHPHMSSLATTRLHTVLDALSPDD